MGRNGAGKTTLLKCAVGLAPITSGTVKVSGNNPAALEGPELIRNVGYVPQEPTDLLYGQSILEECALADKDNKVAEGSTLAIYKSLMQIPDLNSHPRDVSEGQRLGLALSIILSAQPPLIVLDEPTRGLDYQAKKTLIQILKGVAKKEGRAVLISTHDVELVAEVADRVIFLADGELIADGSTSQVLNASPAFAPQVAKALPHTNWTTVNEAERHLNAEK
jgi:energy-coupling factor transport system ATP-binding protein